jgi:tetratricopeptide (TPR) repeat protein
MPGFKKPPFLFLFIFGLLVILPLAWSNLDVVFQRNLLALETARGLLAGESLPEASQFEPLATDCRASWLLGVRKNQAAAQPTLNEYWRHAIQCDPQRAGMLWAYYPLDLGLARQVNAAQPKSAQGWFWLAELTAAEQTDQLIEYYRQGLAIDPSDSYRWRLLGDLLVKADDLAAALEAYRMACRTGDAGGHGCLGAGKIAEQMGDYGAAVGFYRMSRLPELWERAEKLAEQWQERP